jgi:hypothetical protein
LYVCSGPGYAVFNSDPWNRLTISAQAASNHGDYRQAERCYRLALQESKGFAAGDQRIADTLEDLGITLTALKDYRQAEQAYQLCLKHRKQYLGPGSERVAVVLQRLSDLYMFQCQYGNAVKCLEQEVAILDKRYGPTHRYLSFPLEKLGKALDQDQRLVDAEEAATQAIRIRQNYIGADNPYLSSDFAFLAKIKQEQHKFAEAESLNQRAISVADAGFGAENAMLLEPLLALHQLYVRDKRTAEARTVLERALKISQHEGAATANTTLDILMKLIPLYYAEKRYALARDSYRKFMRMSAGRPEFPPAKLQEYTLWLGMQLFNSSENTDLEALIVSGLAMAPRKVDEETVGYVGIIGVAQLQSGQLAKAEQSFRRMLALSETFPGKEDALRGNAAASLALALDSQAKNGEAQHFYKMALAMATKYPNQGYAQRTFQSYAEYLRKAGRLEEAKRLEELARKH